MLAGRYLVDETKATYLTPEQAARGGGDYLRKVLTGEAPLRPGIDYQPGQTKVWSFGRVNHPVYLSHPNPLALSDRERLERVVEWWVKDRAKTKVWASHLMFSIDPRLTSALGAQESTKHLPLDDLLLECVASAMLEYQSKFYPRDQIGFLAGIHHDKGHAHAHVLVHPQTASGRRINLSTNEVEEVDGKRNNVQYQAHLKASFSRQTDALAAYCFGKEKDFTWIGRPATKKDLAHAREEMVLAGRTPEEPGADEGETADARIKSRVQARKKLLGMPNYPQLLRRARQAQRQGVEEQIADQMVPTNPEVDFRAIEEHLEASTVNLSKAAALCASMFGELEREPDRPGPCLLPECRIPISRTSAFLHLQETSQDPLPSPLTVPTFLRRRSSRHAVQLARMVETVADYAQKGREHARIELEQHVCLADSAALLLTYSGELTDRLPDFLREPGEGGSRLPDETVLPEMVAREIRALSAEETRHFQPTDPAAVAGEDPAMVVEKKLPSTPGGEPSGETAVRITPLAYPGVLGLLSDGEPVMPAHWTARLPSVVTPDI